MQENKNENIKLYIRTLVWIGIILAMNIAIEDTKISKVKKSTVVAAEYLGTSNL